MLLFVVIAICLWSAKLVKTLFMHQMETREGVPYSAIPVHRWAKLKQSRVNGRPLDRAPGPQRFRRGCGVR